MKKAPCFAWIRGACALGDKCKFDHDPKGVPKLARAAGGGGGKARGREGCRA